MWEKPHVDGKRKLKSSAIPTIFSFVKGETIRKSPVQGKPLSPEEPELSSGNNIACVVDEALVPLPYVEGLSTSSADLGDEALGLSPPIEGPREGLSTSSADLEGNLPATQKSSPFFSSRENRTPNSPLGITLISF
ncbi:unnamed protein product [Ceutorhynchus assimilis]|uniref:Uncharacterized protein n=1 Tax=Ceutorhynchus assimilis TaxID=467358 RepID=A0A9N9QQB3_9CUCU|nr:unnamed protein product [Ceutorhynchus assimilis]